MMKFTWFSATVLLVAAPTSATEAPPPTAAGELTMCDAMLTEMDVLGARFEKDMIAMGERLGQMATQAIADNATHNAISSTVGKLNWVAPGLGTILGEINSRVLDAKTKKRELQMAREQAVATLSTQQAVDRMMSLSNELILNDCAQL